MERLLNEPARIIMLRLFLKGTKIWVLTRRRPRIAASLTVSRFVFLKEIEGHQLLFRLTVLKRTFSLCMGNASAAI